MKIQGQEIPAKEYFQPAVNAGRSLVQKTPGFLKKFGVIIGGLLFLIMVVFIVFRFGPEYVINVTSQKVLVIETGAGGFSLPATDIFWASGHHASYSRGDFWLWLFGYGFLSSNKTTVLNAEQAIVKLNLEDLRASPCQISDILDAPGYTLFAPRYGLTVQLTALDAVCYRDGAILKPIFDIL